MFAIRCKKHGIFPVIEKSSNGCWSEIYCEECKKEYKYLGKRWPEKYCYCGKLRRNRSSAIKNWNDDNKKEGEIK